MGRAKGRTLHWHRHNGPVTANRRNLQLALDETVYAYLRPGAIGLAVLYVIFTIAHWLWLPAPAKGPMTAIAFGSALLLFGIAEALRRWYCPVSWTHAVAAGLAGIVLLNVLSHIYFTGLPRETTNLILLIIGTGFVFLSTRWLVVVLGAALAGWGAVTWSLTANLGNYIDWGVVSAVALACILHVGRLSTCRRLQELRLRDRQSMAKLQGTVILAEQELAERRRAEEELARAKDELEVRVEERTAELAEANTVLRTEIAQREKAEAQLRHSQKMDAVGQLAAGVAHDFNNMLTVIQGHASCLERGVKSEQQRVELLREIIAAAERAASLTRQLLVFSRKQPMQLRRIDLNELTQNLARMLGRILGEHIELKLEQNANLPTLEGDPGMIEQVLLNLAVNARDAMPSGGHLTIQTSVITMDGALMPYESSTQTGEWVRLTVKDNGCGIDPSLLPRIFEPFFTTKPIGKGAGLGLSTVYGIVKQHKGWIDVTSEVGAGTTFHIHFPAVSFEPDAPAPIREVQRIPSGNECILVVEDEPAVRQLASRFLRDSGYRVLEADSGVAALPVWQEHNQSIDLLLTDLVMPGGMSGRQLAERLLADKPSLRVIYTSGYSTDFADLESSLRDGHKFLSKPYRFDTLAKTIRAALDSRGGSLKV